MNRQAAARSTDAAKAFVVAGALLQRNCECGGAPGVSGECDECRNEHSLRGAAEAPASVREVLRGAGEPLDRESRSFFDARFGHDFSRVRIHADSRAGESAEEIGARAYTVGNHIAFAAGRYSPSSAEGRRLLAHELMHTIQQQDSFSSKLTIGDSAVHEREADRAAAAIHSGGPMLPATAQVAAGIARDKDDSEAAKTEAKPAECPKTHTIPDDVYDAIGAAWKKSGHGGKTVAEQGGRIITDSAGKRVIRTGSGGIGSISSTDVRV